MRKSTAISASLKDRSGFETAGFCFQRYRNGNIFATGPGGIRIFSPQGKHLGTIQLPEIAANVAWGDADGQTLYITARTGLYRIHLNTTGPRP